MYYQKENFNGIYDYRCNFHNGFVVGGHIHEYSEILYCKKGRCEVFLNSKKLVLSDNEFVFIPPNYIHQIFCSDAEVICAVFSNDFIPLFFKAIKGRKLSECSFNAEGLKEIFLRLPKTDKSDTLLLTAYLNLIADRVLKLGEFKKASPAEGILYQKVISYVSENFKEDISLNMLANKFGYNKKYLSSAMHSLTGIHFSDFIAMYRVEFAKELLAKKPALSVAEISMECGFSAVNSFNRQFKRLTKMTPSEFKKLYSISEG